MNNEINENDFRINIKSINMKLSTIRAEEKALEQTLGKYMLNLSKKISEILTQIPNDDNQNVINVFSRGIAESLVVDYGHFDKLINIKKNEKRKNFLVYVFKKTDEVEKDFKSILGEVKKQKVEREKQNKEIDEALKNAEEKKEVKNNEG